MLLPLKHPTASGSPTFLLDLRVSPTSLGGPRPASLARTLRNAAATGDRRDAPRAPPPGPGRPASPPPGSLERV